VSCVERSGVDKDLPVDENGFRLRFETGPQRVDGADREEGDYENYENLEVSSSKKARYLAGWLLYAWVLGTFPA
jgi:hypothetical protein